MPLKQRWLSVFLVIGLMLSLCPITGNAVYSGSDSAESYGLVGLKFEYNEKQQSNFIKLTADMTGYDIANDTGGKFFEHIKDADGFVKIGIIDANTWRGENRDAVRKALTASDVSAWESFGGIRIEIKSDELKSMIVDGKEKEHGVPGDRRLVITKKMELDDLPSVAGQKIYNGTVMAFAWLNGMNVDSGYGVTGTGGKYFAESDYVGVKDGKIDAPMCLIDWYRIENTGEKYLEDDPQVQGIPMVFPKPNPTRENFTFSGWYTDRGEQVKEGALVPNAVEGGGSLKKIAYYAHWVERINDVQIESIDVPRALQKPDVEANLKRSANRGVLEVSSVTWKDPNGRVLGEDDVFQGSTAYTVIVEVRAKENFKFDGKLDIMTINGHPAKVVSDEHIWPSDYLKLSYTFPPTGEVVKLTYDYNDDDMREDNFVTTAVGNTVTLTEPRPWNSNEFQYWYDAANDTFYNAGEAYPVSGAAVLKAIWKIDLNGATINVEAPVCEREPQMELGIEETAPYTGEISWKSDAGAEVSGNFDYSTVYIATITLTAKSADMSKGKYTDNGYSFLSTATGNVVNGTVSNCTVTPPAGIGNTLTFDVTFEATAAEVPYSITYDPNGATDGKVDRGSVAKGGDITLAEPGSYIKPGYTQTGWSLEKNSKEPVTEFKNVQEHKIVYAIWEPKQVIWEKPSYDTYTYGTEITPSAPIPAPAVDPSGPEDAENGTVRYELTGGSAALAEYGLTFRSDGTITGTPKKAGSIQGVQVTVTAKNGSSYRVNYNPIPIGKADLTITPKTTLNTTTSRVSSLRVSDFIFRATVKLDDTVAELFNAQLGTPDKTGAFTGNGVTITFCKEDGTPLTGLPTMAGTYKYKVSVPKDDNTTFNDYILKQLTETGTLGVLRVTDSVDTDIRPGDSTGGNNGGGTSAGGKGHTVTYKPGDHGTFNTGEKTTETVSNGKCPTHVPNTVPERGWHFLGWSSDGKTIVDPKKIPVTEDITYTALYGKADHVSYMMGRTDGTFDPDGNMTRAEAATILSRLTVGFTEGGTYPMAVFSDVTAGKWYTQYVNFATNKGIINGYPDGSFRPDGKITRAEFATMIANYLGLSKAYAASRYTDVDGHWGSVYITALDQRGLINGYPDGTFRPDRTITRAEAATMMNGAIDRTPDETLDLPAGGYVNPFPDVTVSAWFYEQVMEATVDHAIPDFHKNKT